VRGAAAPTGATVARARPRKVMTPSGPVWAESIEQSGPVAKISKEMT
jgi:hypothetical protein